MTNILIAIGSLGTLLILAVTLIWTWYINRPRIVVGTFEQDSYYEAPQASIGFGGCFLLQSKTPAATSLTEYRVELTQPQRLSVSTTRPWQDTRWAGHLERGDFRTWCPLPIPGGQATVFELHLAFYEMEAVRGQDVRGRLTLCFMHTEKSVEIRAQFRPLEPQTAS